MIHLSYASLVLWGEYFRTSSNIRAELKGQSLVIFMLPISGVGPLDEFAVETYNDLETFISRHGHHMREI